MKTIRKTLAALLTGLALTAGGPALADNPAELKLDYATYSPTSLVVRKMGWMEEEFKADGVPVKWTFSQGSANALDFLKKGSIDFASSAGLAAVLARAAGTPVKGVYLFSKPEWVAMGVHKDSTIASIKELKGKKVAATPGTDAYLFTLRALALNGMKKSDIDLVPMAHLLGRKALEAKEVDAWCALDPHQAASVLEAGTKVIYRNPEFNTYGFLNTTDAYAAKYPDTVKRVLKVYEKARAWVVANPDQAAQLLADEAKVSLAVAKQQMGRNDFSNPVPGAEHVTALKAAVPVLVSEQLVPSEEAANKAIDELVDGSFAKDLK